MSYPKKTKGWRNITIDEHQFRWHFDTGYVHAQLTLQGMDSSRRQVVVEMTQWHDVWLYIQDDLPLNEPVIVTPKFASAAIQFALANGWNPEQAGSPFRVSYQDKTFTLEDARPTAPPRQSK